ncbi:MAG: hypothetical protein J6M05_04905 [Cardiobacteriaceae bacterium]|nr:hypothetical protein [Cardiobacteriaceae bacterium]
MMKLFLDTNTVSEIRLVASGKANAHFEQWIQRIDTSRCFTSVIVLMELER